MAAPKSRQFLFLLLIITSLSFAACAPIVACGTIIASGDYCLTADVSSVGTCFSLAALPNTQIDCQGHSITGSNMSSTAGVYSNATNITVKNCRIYDYEWGVFFFMASNSTIDNVTASTSAGKGFDMQGVENISILNSNGNGSGDGLLLDVGLGIGSNHNTIMDSYFTTNGARSAIEMSLDASHNQFQNVTSETSTAQPLLMSGGTNNTFIDFTLIDGGTTGAAAITTNGNRFSRCVFISARKSGLYLTGANNTFDFCLISGNDSLWGAVNPYTSDAIGNNFTNSIIDGNGNTYGAVIQAGVANSRFINNTFRNATTAVRLDAGTDANIFLENTFRNVTVWLNNSDPSNIFNDSNKGNKFLFPNDANACSVFDCTIAIPPGYATAGTSLPFNATTVGGNWTGVGQDWHPWTEIATPSPPSPTQSNTLISLVLGVAAGLILIVAFLLVLENLSLESVFALVVITGLVAILYAAIANS